MLARRLLLLVVLLMGLSVLAYGINPPAPRTRSTTPIVPAPSVTGQGTSPTDVERTLDASSESAPVVAVDEGDDLHLTVNANALDSVEVVGLDQLQAVSPDSPAVFDIRADQPGRYPIVLSDASRTIGFLRVTPAGE